MELENKRLQNYSLKILRAGIDDYCLPIKRAPDQELFFVVHTK
jgi:hypothetical protein